MPQVRLFSFGGGVQSVAALVLAARKEIDFNTFCFANVGDDSESPDTIAYFHGFAMPYALRHGLNLVMRRRQLKNGNYKTLYQACVEPSRTIPIPIYLKSGAPGTRKCTADFKIRVVARYMRELRPPKSEPGVVGIGISLDEWSRAKDSRIPYIKHEHPLLDLKISRRDCGNIIRDAGLPVPPKSSCWFCPYKKLSEWQEMATHDQDRFKLAVELELELELKRKQLDKDSVFLTRRLVPLDQAVLPCDQLKLPLDEECTGYCWT